MIYINKVMTNAPMKAIETERDFLFFRDYKPQYFNYPQNEQEEQRIKMHQMKVVIAGKMTGNLKRNNENVFSRSLLFLDFDEIQETESDFLQKLGEELDKINYCIYPTLKYKQDNLRYRLVIELDREVNASEYEKLLFGISHELGVKFVFDTSNRTWSQGQGLPVATSENQQAKRFYREDGEKIPVDKFLLKINQSKEFKRESKGFKSGNGRKRQANGDNERKYTGLLLEKMFDGQLEGGRNNWWREVVDSLLNVDTPVATIEKIMLCLNGDSNIFPQPLEVEELEKVFLSRVNNHVKKGGDVY